MIRLVLGRVLQGSLLLLLLSFVIYGLMGLMPGDPVDLMVSSDPNLTPEDARRLKALYGLDRPIGERWWRWLTSALEGELGYSRLYRAPVGELLAGALGRSLALLVPSIAFALAGGVALGVIGARRPGGWGDLLVNAVALAGLSVPVFWLALMLIMLFSVELGWLPAGGTGAARGDGATLRHLVLPVLCLTLTALGTYARHTRAAMRDVLEEDYVRWARARGLPEARVVLGHALPNALMPVVTLLGLDVGALFSGALVTETLFAWPGIGKLIYDAVLGNDYNLALAALMLASALTLAGSLFADLLYGWLDPRVRYR